MDVDIDISHNFSCNFDLGMPQLAGLELGAPFLARKQPYWRVDLMLDSTHALALYSFIVLTDPTGMENLGF